MQRTFLNPKTNTWHTYEFLKKRRNDPKWHDGFIEAQKIVRRDMIIMGILLFIIANIGIWLYGGYVASKYHKTHDPISYAASLFGVKQTESMSKSSYDSADADNSLDTVKEKAFKNYIVGKGYRIEPALYDDESVSQAISEEKVPANLIEDGTKLVYFADKGHVIVKGMGDDQEPHRKGFDVIGSSLMINTISYTIPYEIKGDAVYFQTWKDYDFSGSGKGETHEITWQMVGDPNAQKLANENK
ncbi:hypothetical protein [Xylocopilactobacillus apis]|uniref:Uncharacterized protein n=1 Tax=Xylocopilactobacillus apis TaxID=2932183 RepID=A0AAU9DFY7_9LACO|nr:hypothetical protein [Xylocopilactobacillus apis]BDR57166.1 hypothetical protein KIMC2_17280 [Xylocopilactobacillus apis]